ncbi:hypothetical protein L208DRAFT_1112977, partial [Tricholoma matsutake]
FGFLDLADILHACHMIPAFTLGQTEDLLPSHSFAHRSNEEEKDFVRYYVNFFVDRDMVCLFTGIGIGHTLIHSHLKGLLNNVKAAFVKEKAHETDDM